MSVDLNYQQHGDAQAPAVVLLGSLGSDNTMWQPQLRPLATRFRVIAVDHRGHGKSPAPAGPYTVADLGQDVLALLDSLGVESAHLVGLSLGGAVAQWIAARHPDRVDSLSLLATSAAFAPPEPWAERARAVRTDGVAAIAPTVVGRWFTPALAERDPELVARHVAMVAATPDEGYAACCDALAAWDGRPDLARISAPTLVIAGAQDPSTPPAVGAEIASGIAVSELRVVDPAAHLLNVEQAGAVTKLLLAHIGAHTVDPQSAMRVRRSVLGDAHVDRSIANATEFTQPFQDFITRTAWGDIWSRPGLDHHTRRLLTLAILTAVGNDGELDMHIRAALRAGVDPDELVEVFLHTAVYAGVPNSNHAFALGKQALEDLDREENPT